MLLTLTARAQRPTDIWYFGQQAGLSFADGTPKPLNDGKMSTYEGCAVATTAKGELLFYTNGETVWNRQHQPMPNGVHLMGSGSSTQSALIVPDPGSGNIFYIFTVAPQGTPNGLRYSMVDMTRADGLGDLPRVNLLLIQPVAEKLAAVRHANGRDTWVVAHRWNSNAFVSYLVTAEGVAGKPMHEQRGQHECRPRPQRHRRAQVLARWQAPGRRAVEGNQQIRSLRLRPQHRQGEQPAQLRPLRRGLRRGVFARWQARFTAPATAWAAAKPKSGSSTSARKHGAPVLVGKSANRKIGALQLGPDGRIYVAREDNPNLGVIEQPNVIGKDCQLRGRGPEAGRPPQQAGPARVCGDAVSEGIRVGCELKNVMLSAAEASPCRSKHSNRVTIAREMLRLRSA